MPRNFCTLAALFFTLASASVISAADTAPPAAPAAPAAYPIKLERPAKSGDAYSVHLLVEGSTSTVFHPAGSPDRTTLSSFTADLTAKVQVAEVDQFGREKSFSLTISSLRSGPDKPSLVPEGTIIDVTRTAKEATFKRHDGQELSKEAADALDHLFEKLPPDSIPDDLVIGSHEPHKPGDSWPLNGAAAAQDAANQDVKIDPRNISGTVTFTKVEPVNGINALHFTSTLAATDQQPPLAPGLSVEHSDLNSTLTLVVPADATLPRLSAEVTEDIHLHLTNSAAPGATADATIHYHKKESTSAK